MDMSMLDAATTALLTILDPSRLLLLAVGVVMGLSLGVLPGIGGLAATALLLPFTFTMDPHAAFALLLGLGAATATGDPIPAILFGVPGGAGSAATVLDGYPMAKRGEAGRALSAAYMSSMIGGVFGAMLMGLTLPLLRPLMLFIGSPELLAFSCLGLSMVAVLSGNAPLRGLTAAGLGLMISMIGADPQTGTLRWTMGSLYLWEGLPLIPAILGLFAIPELADLAISRTSIAGGAPFDAKAGMREGAMDCFRNFWLVVRCSWIGSTLGAVPGIGGSVIDWVAYGHALRTEKGAEQTFGSGDVRGVIASEASNNSREGGALVPTVAFGIPGSAGMAILLGAFLMHGLVPGPDMLSVNLSVTYSMVWSIAIANILGAGICYLLSGQFAKLAQLRYTLILPSVLSIIFIGAFQGSQQWGDLYTMMIFGLVGWTMKMLKWPRPPLILGLVLGASVERYLFISIERYGIEWFSRPIVLVLFGFAALGLLRPLIRDARAHGSWRNMLADYGRPAFRATDLFNLLFIAVLVLMLYEAAGWNFKAKIIPMVVGISALIFAVLSLVNQVCRRLERERRHGLADDAKANVSRKIHMDLASDTAHLTRKQVFTRAASFFGWLTGFLVSMSIIGLVPTVPLFIAGYMRTEAREPWRIVLPMAIGMTVFIAALFNYFLPMAWPPTFLGHWFPALKVIPSV
ncbi:tripartite tricarboxylate transporter permease [Jiella sonneratiae]|uniref:Tripartite tricarboxylate transporter permease n=1 Tax=Jiella sonneratiae TaxID=2816856 RepID=A0ABS3J8U2_9HYPH|nr:tripartite tricarboxylate transporter permease [Jiella sonneratiae]MBO0906093.1 tripartite tricarboxylate transporter permease [Jiella sonneratiae]